MEDLRELILELAEWLGEPALARLCDAVAERAARSDSGYVARGPGGNIVSEIEDFAAAARSVGYADPDDVDAYLRAGTSAYLSKDYAAARRIFGALLEPIGSFEIDLGQYELTEDALGVDLGACAAHYVVAVYMTAASARRAAAVFEALDAVSEVGHFWAPLHEMERVAIEPLPELEEFLEDWRSVVETCANQSHGTHSMTDDWLREVVQRMQGPSGLADLARASGSPDDLGAWCRAHVRSGDWKAALAAYEEAAGIADDEYLRGVFLDGAALAARELGGKDLSRRFERAWRAAPEMDRLCRWLGAAKTKKTLAKRAAGALSACPADAVRQRAFLFVLGGDIAAAASLLSTAPGLGWSSEDHPGHLLFPLFASFGGVSLLEEPSRDFDELGEFFRRDEPRLVTPPVADIIEMAGVNAPQDPGTRQTVLESMRAAAERRLVGVTSEGRRRHYAHAASLACACAHFESSPDASRWFAGIREKYRRYHALQRELRRLAG